MDAKLLQQAVALCGVSIPQGDRSGSQFAHQGGLLVARQPGVAPGDRLPSFLRRVVAMFVVGRFLNRGHEFFDVGHSSFG